MDEIDCKTIVSNSHVLSKQTSKYTDDNIKNMSISEEVSNSEGMSNSDTKIRNVEVQIIPLCIRYKTVDKSDWKPNIRKCMLHKIG